jgi:hypothetical protein
MFQDACNSDAVGGTVVEKRLSSVLSKPVAAGRCISLQVSYFLGFGRYPSPMIL